jgi:prophage regulatory protein
MAHTVLRLPAVKARTGLSRSSIYKFASGGCFPKPVRLGARSVGWLEAEIDEWLGDRKDARSTKAPQRGLTGELR